MTDGKRNKGDVLITRRKRERRNSGEEQYREKSDRMGRAGRKGGLLGKWKLKKGVVWAVRKRIILPTGDVFYVFFFKGVLSSGFGLVGARSGFGLSCEADLEDDFEGLSSRERVRHGGGRVVWRGPGEMRRGAWADVNSPN